MSLKCPVQSNRRFSLKFVAARFGARLLTPILLALMTANLAFCQTSADSLAQPLVSDEIAGAAQSESQAQSGSNGQATETQQKPAPQTEKGRLSVNPVTGLVSSPSSSAGFRPLTGKERWKLYWKQNYGSVGAYFGPVFTAAVLDQTSNSPPQWGTGISGFGLRVASRTTSGILQGTVQAPLAAVLHEDVRYITSRKGAGKHRVLHAIVYSFMTYNNQGRPTPNIANLTGYYVSTAISTTWLPSHPWVVKYAFVNGSEQIALTVPVNILQEFWPDITQKFFHRSGQSKQSSPDSQ